MKKCCHRKYCSCRSLRKIIVICVIYVIYVIYKKLNCGTSGLFQPTSFDCHCQSQKPQLLAEPQVFHKLTVEESKRCTPCVMAYSAFFDHRDHAVKVVTDSDLSCFRSVSVTCQLWYNTSESPFTSDLVFDYHLLENEKTEAADRLGAVYTCEARSNTTDVPYAVSFYSQRDVCKCKPTLSMKVHYPETTMHKFAVCVPALYGSLSVEELIGFVELHHLLGAEKFYFYDENVSADVKRVLKSYSQRGLAEVLQWQPKFPSDKTYHNQQVMQLDCSLRNLRQSVWVAQMDLDEALLPTEGRTWSRMVSDNWYGDTGAFIFLNRFFSDYESECHNAQSSDKRKFSSDQRVPVYLRRLRYYDEAFPPGARSKIMYRPEATAQARTHMVVLRPGFDLVVLNYNKAANCHYRHAPSVGTTHTRLDQSACRHYALLMSNVHRAIQAV